MCLEKEYCKDVQNSFSFKSGAFDLVNCFDILEHLEYPVKSIENMFEVCQNVMIYTTPDRAVEDPVRMVMEDFDGIYINAILSSGRKKGIQSRLRCNLLKVDTFYELTPGTADKLLFSNHLKCHAED